MLGDNAGVGQEVKTHGEKIDLGIRNIEINSHGDRVQQQEHDRSQSRIHPAPQILD